MSKYRIRKVARGGTVFDSKAESERYLELSLMEKAGVIEALHYHGIRFHLGVSDKGKAITYIPDFTYIEDGRLIAEEVKGVRVRDWPVRAALFKDKFPEWELRVIKA